MKKVAVFLANGYEEIEALSVVDVLRRANIDCRIVSIEDQYEVVSSHKVKLVSDILLSELKADDYEAFVLPGGLPGSENLANNEELMDLLKIENKKGKIIAAMCAGPLGLGLSGILDGKNAVCYPGFEARVGIEDASDKPGVVKDANIITAKGPAYALAFAYEILEELSGKESVNELKEAMLYNMLLACN